MKKRLTPVLFFGSLWGIAEAVLGYLLHLIPVGVSGFIMFPVGFYFMYSAFKKTNDVMSIFLVGCAAALIKLADLALPLLPAIKTLVPSAAIMFESCATALAFMVFKSMKNKLVPGGILTASMGWRLMFLSLQFALTWFLIPSGLIAGGVSSILNFVLLEGLVNAAILFVFAFFANRTQWQMIQNRRISPAAALAALAAAGGSTVVFALL